MTASKTVFVGTPGDQGPPGARGLTPRGAWDATTAYAIGDSVSFVGGSYVALVANTGVAPTNTGTWSVLLAPPGALSGVNIDGGQVGTTPAINYQILTINGGTP